MNYFITGATGFLGGYITSYLLDGGHLVTALVATRDEAREMASFGVRPHVAAVTDKEAMRRGMRGSDGVFHVAGHRLGIADRKLAEAVHVEGTRNVLELVRELAISKVVHTSTLSVFSDTKGKVPDESYRFTGRHLTRYDALRARAHYDVALPMLGDGLPGVILMPGATYGPRDTSAMARLLTEFLLGRIRFASDVTAYCWAHVEDVAQAHVLAMEFGQIGETYIVGGEVHTVWDVLAEAGRLVGRAHPPFRLSPWVVKPVAAAAGGIARVLPPLRPLADRLRVATGVTYLGDDTKARTELGFSPRSLEEGLPEAIQWLLRDLFERV